MAGSSYGGGVSGRTHLDRHLLRDLDRLPSPRDWRMEYGYWLRFYRRRLLTRHQVEIVE